MRRQAKEIEIKNLVELNTDSQEAETESASLSLTDLAKLNPVDFRGRSIKPFSRPVSDNSTLKRSTLEKSAGASLANQNDLNGVSADEQDLPEGENIDIFA